MCVLHSLAPSTQQRARSLLRAHRATAPTPPSAGWHGIDCAHAAAEADTSAPGLEQQRPWIRPHIHTPAAQPLAANATRKRPLIYV